MTASDYQSSYERLQLGLAITLGIKKFIVSYDYTTINEGNTLKNVLKIVTVVVKIIEKYLRCRSSRSQMFFKVTVLKKDFNLQFY